MESTYQKPIIENNQVKFWRPNSKNGEFSNFFESSITLQGKIWKTNEHYFQAQKFAGTSKEERIRNLATPGQTFKLGRTRDKNFPLREDWERAKENVMRQCCRAKFTQNENLKQFLLDTGNCEIIEASPRDSYWGTGRTGKGKNRLAIKVMGNFLPPQRCLKKNKEEKPIQCFPSPQKQIQSTQETLNFQQISSYQDIQDEEEVLNQVIPPKELQQLSHTDFKDDSQSISASDNQMQIEKNSDEELPKEEQQDEEPIDQEYLEEEEQKQQEYQVQEQEQQEQEQQDQEYLEKEYLEQEYLEQEYQEQEYLEQECLEQEYLEQEQQQQQEQQVQEYLEQEQQEKEYLELEQQEQESQEQEQQEQRDLENLEQEYIQEQQEPKSQEQEQQMQEQQVQEQQDHEYLEQEQQEQQQQEEVEQEPEIASLMKKKGKLQQRMTALKEIIKRDLDNYQPLLHIPEFHDYRVTGISQKLLEKYQDLIRDQRNNRAFRIQRQRMELQFCKKKKKLIIEKLKELKFLEQISQFKQEFRHEMDNKPQIIIQIPQYQQQVIQLPQIEQNIPNSTSPTRYIEQEPYDEIQVPKEQSIENIVLGENIEQQELQEEIQVPEEQPIENIVLSENTEQQELQEEIQVPEEQPIENIVLSENIEQHKLKLKIKTIRISRTCKTKVKNLVELYRIFQSKLSSQVKTLQTLGNQQIDLDKWKELEDDFLKNWGYSNSNPEAIQGDNIDLIPLPLTVHKTFKDSPIPFPWLVIPQIPDKTKIKHREYIKKYITPKTIKMNNFKTDLYGSIQYNTCLARLSLYIDKVVRFPHLEFISSVLEEDVTYSVLFQPTKQQTQRFYSDIRKDLAEGKKYTGSYGQLLDELRRQSNESLPQDTNSTPFAKLSSEKIARLCGQLLHQVLFEKFGDFKNAIYQLQELEKELDGDQFKYFRALQEVMENLKLTEYEGILEKIKLLVAIRNKMGKFLQRDKSAIDKRLRELEDKSHFHMVQVRLFRAVNNLCFEYFPYMIKVICQIAGTHCKNSYKVQYEDEYAKLGKIYDWASLDQD